MDTLLGDEGRNLERPLEFSEDRGFPEFFIYALMDQLLEAIETSNKKEYSVVRATTDPDGASWVEPVLNRKLSTGEKK